MGMPVTVEIVGDSATPEALEKAFSYFRYVDGVFSTYKPESEISKINHGELREDEYSDDMRTVFRLAEETKRATGGYFDIVTPDGTRDPSGLVKGWAIRNAAELLARDGFTDFYVDAGGDIEARGRNERGEPWRVGIANPFNSMEIVKAVAVSGKGVATSGTYVRGDHIYDPKTRRAVGGDIISLTVIGPDVYEADRFATAAFAMGKDGISFIAGLAGFEGYCIDRNKTATMTDGFNRYVIA